MITLRELFKVMWEITELGVTARDPETERFLHEWQYGKYIHETIHMYHDRRAGKLSIINKNINHHGKPKGNGFEMGWGVSEKVFPTQLIDAEITHLITSPLPQGRGYRVSCDISLDESIVKILLELEKKHEQ